MDIQTVFTIINIVSLILMGVGYFKKNYTIVDLETWNKVAEVYNEHADDDENEELEGGVGFFKECLEVEDEDEEDDDPAEEEENKKENK